MGTALKAIPVLRLGGKLGAASAAQGPPEQILTAGTSAGTSAGSAGSTNPDLAPRF